VKAFIRASTRRVRGGIPHYPNVGRFLVELLTGDVLRFGELFLSYNSQQLQLPVALRARRGGEYQQRLRLILGEQRLTVELDWTELRMNECLVSANRFAPVTQALRASA
jgi:hypothetical protein